MFDHVTIRVSDLSASRRFYDLAIGGKAPHDEWGDFSIAAGADVTRGLHIGFRANARADVDTWWRRLVDAGYESDGGPGLRPEYGPDYYGAFVLDPDGNSVEAVHNPPLRSHQIDHLWMRVQDIEASRRFYEVVAGVIGFEVAPLPDGRVHFRDAGGTWSILEGERPTHNLHIAFPAHDLAQVEAFHRALVGAGYRDNGPPGERPVYHPGYYGAFVLDPDGNNVEAVFHDR